MTDARMAAYPFHLPSIREGGDRQDAHLFCHSPVERHVRSAGDLVWAMPSTTFMLDVERRRDRTQKMTPELLPPKRKAQTSHAAIDLALDEVYKVFVRLLCDGSAWAAAATAHVPHR